MPQKLTNLFITLVSKINSQLLKSFLTIKELLSKFTVIFFRQNELLNF
ncbi:hypothetical protein CLV57_2427 [Mucilaginibacter auburnensis]|uniref:Uncharacterized protein n=1 Tax=Mucilaginibacter auburnensis TaxID=1457233 RepID=A0A2H9VLX5_9SPHI|nr:hypothetical protein CLV57_2427 [Mucilaginibacter auburnensis]